MNDNDTKIKIVGIGGLPRSGKDMLANKFIEAGYFGVSLGDIVRNATRIRHADKPDPISRANTTETSNWLRQQKGPDFALKEALELYKEASKSKEYRGLLAWSIRAPVEVDFIYKNNGRLIWIEASDKVRYERAMQELRHGEAIISPEEFKRQEDEQWIPNNPDLPAEIQMNVSYVKDNAREILENNSNDLEEFNEKAEALVN